MHRSYSRFFLRCVFAPRLSLVIAGVIALAISSAFAKVVPMQFCVDKSGANGCSTTIQDAVNLVPSAGSAIITIAAGTFAEDVTVFNRTVRFVGKGPGMTIVDGTNNSQLPTFNFTSNSSGELHNLTIENGSGADASNVLFFQENARSGGVGTLTIENCEITGGVHPFNVAPSGAVSFFGKTLTIDSTSITNNQDLGLFIFNGQVFITNTTISGNTIAGNTGTAEGCGIHASLLRGSLMLDNVTITDNACVGGPSGPGLAPNQGGGIWADLATKVSMANTVIANNTVSGSMAAGPDCYSPGKGRFGLKSMGYNLIKDHSACMFTPAKTDLAEGTDPGLSSLAACASSALEVQMPMGGSPLIGKGNPGTPTGKVGTSSSSCLPVDECGSARAKANCDIGARQ